MYLFHRFTALSDLIFDSYAGLYGYNDRVLKGWLTGFFLGLIVFMGCSLACVHACFFKNALFFT